MMSVITGKQNLNHLYLQRVPAILIEQVCQSFVTLDAKWQVSFLQQTTNSPISLRFPSSSHYRQTVMKRIVKMIESRGFDVCDEMMEAFGHAMAETADEFGYRTCLLPNNISVTILESELLISNGTTGLQTWSASMRLAEYMVNEEHLLRDKQILELGSGLGLMGLILCAHCSPSKYVFTDFHQHVMEKLAINISTNHNECCCERTSSHTSDIARPEVKRKWPSRTCKLCGCVYCDKELGQLEWSTIDKLDAQQLDYDTIVAADVVYDIDLVPYLVRALRILHDRRPDCVTYIATTVRKPETLQAFVNALEDRDLMLIDLITPPSHHFYVSDANHVLHKIVCKL